MFHMIRIIMSLIFDVYTYTENSDEADFGLLMNDVYGN